MIILYFALNWMASLTRTIGTDKVNIQKDGHYAKVVNFTWYNQFGKCSGIVILRQ